MLLIIQGVAILVGTFVYYMAEPLARIDEFARHIVAGGRGHLPLVVSIFGMGGISAHYLMQLYEASLLVEAVDIFIRICAFSRPECGMHPAHAVGHKAGEVCINGHVCLARSATVARCQAQGKGYYHRLEEQ